MTRCGLACAVLVITAWLLPLPGASAAPLLEESFAGTSQPDDWTFVTGQGNGPSMTDNWLRLTDDETDQASFVYHNHSIPTINGLIIEFDFVIWSTTSSVADGFVFAVFDADVTDPEPGGYGGSLGYAQRSTIPGMAGGIAGFGFDEFGNFSNPTEGREGGPGQTSNAIVIRGSQGATRNDGYEYQTGTGSLSNFATPSAATRDDAIIHGVRITIPTSRNVTIEWRDWDSADGGSWSAWETILGPYQCTITCPEEVKVGFTAGTGAVTAYHEVRNLSITAVPEPCALSFFLLGSYLLFFRRRGRGRLRAA